MPLGRSAGFGGAKALAIVCDPKKLSPGEKERLTRRYTSGNHPPIIGPTIQVIFPRRTAGTDGQVMSVGALDVPIR